MQNRKSSAISGNKKQQYLEHLLIFNYFLLLYQGRLVPKYIFFLQNKYVYINYDQNNAMNSLVSI